MDSDGESFHSEEPPVIQLQSHSPSVDSCLGEEVLDEQFGTPDDHPIVPEELPEIVVHESSLPLPNTPPTDQSSRSASPSSRPATAPDLERRRSSTTPLPTALSPGSDRGRSHSDPPPVDPDDLKNSVKYDVYFSFPEYRDDITENTNSTFFGEMKKKFNEAFSWKEDGGHYGNSGDVSRNSPSVNSSGLRMRSEAIRDASPDNRQTLDINEEQLSESDLRARGKTSVSSTNSTGNARTKGAVAHSEDNRKQIEDRINLLRRNKAKEHMQRFWMPDSTCTECYSCLRPFTKIRRKHHCRICGNIFCNRCCSNYLAIMIGMDLNKNRTERTCNYCRETAENFCSPSTVASIESANLAGSSVGRKTSTGLPEFPSWVKKLAPMFSRSAEDSASTMDEKHRSKLLRDCLVDLEKIWQEIMESRQGLPFIKVRYRLRTYTDCMSGKAIVDWLRENDKVRGPEADLQALWLGKALIDASFLTPLNSRNNEFKNDANIFYRSAGENAFVMSFTNSQRDILGSGSVSRAQKTASDESGDLESEPPWVQHVQGSSSEDESESDDEALGYSNRDSGLRPGVAHFPSTSMEQSLYPQPPNTGFSDSYDYWSADMSMKLKRDHLAFSRDGSVDYFPVLPLSLEALEMSVNEIPSAANTPMLMPSLSTPSLGSALVPVIKIKEDESVLNDRQAVQEISKNSYLMHMIAFLHQLLCYYDVDFRWAPLLFRLSKTLGETVKPNFRNNDALDIRRYVKVKCVPGGEAEDSRIINGVAFSGNVTCKGMNSIIEEPSYALLCRGSVECNNHRNSEGDPTRMVSLQTILGQKKMYNELCTKRILAIKPYINLVLMEFTVASKVQKLLMEENISVVKNIKQINLQRLARVLECEVADRVENLGLTDTQYTPGRYKKFYVEYFKIGSMNKSICVFDECVKEKFATILLRGSEDAAELKKVKHILLEMTLANYNRVLERAYFLDSNGQHRVFFKHLPFTAKIMEFTAQHLSKVVPANNMNLLHKRSEAVQKIREQSANASPATSSPVLKSRFTGTKGAISVLDTACVEAPLEPNENSLFYIHSQQFRSTVLSMSPHVLISCPFLESNLGYNSPIRRYLVPRAQVAKENKDMRKYWSGLFPGETPLPPVFKSDGIMENLEDVAPEFDLEMLPFEETAIFDPSNIVELPPHPFLSYITSKPLDGPEFLNLLADFRLRGYNLAFDDIANIRDRHNKRMMEKRRAFDCKMNKRKLHFQSRRQKPDCLDYRYHQKINVLILISSNSQSKDPSRCCYLIYRDLPFYLQGDMTLGSFLEKFCFSDKVCINPQCEFAPEVHKRRFFSANYCLHVSLHNEVKTSQKPPDTIVMWNFCPSCKKLGQISKMSENTWNYSFGKFLENCLSAFNVEVVHSEYTPSASPASSPDHTSVCSHSMFRDHHQYFMYKQRVAAFRVSKINVYEVAFPEKFSLFGSFKYSLKKFNDEQKSLFSKIEGVSKEVDDKLNRCGEHLKNIKDESGSSSIKSAKYKAAQNLKQICQSFEVNIKSDCSLVKAELEQNCQTSDSDWIRYDTILLMKHVFYQFCLKWSANLSKLVRAENEYKAILGKDNRNLGMSNLYATQFYLNSTSPIERVTSNSSVALDNFELECSTESTGSHKNMGTDHFGEDPFDNQFEIKDMETERKVDAKQSLYHQSPIVEATTEGATVAVNIVSQRKSKVEDGIMQFVKVTTKASSPKKSHVDIEESFCMPDGYVRKRGKFTKAKEVMCRSIPHENNRETASSSSSRPTTTSSNASQITEASSKDGSVRNITCDVHARQEDVGKRVVVTYDSQTKQGVLKWVGHLTGPEVGSNHTQNLFGGIELDEEQNVGGNGCFNKEQIFECETNRGVFAPLVGVFLLQNTESGNDEAHGNHPEPFMATKAINKPVPELSSHFPFNEKEHFIMDVDKDDQFMPILIRDNEPGSIIAYSMASSFYRSKLAKEEAEIASMYTNSNTVFIDQKMVEASLMLPDNQRYTFKSKTKDFETSTCKDSMRPVNVSNAAAAATGQPKLKQMFIEHTFSSLSDKERRCDFYCKSWYPLEFRNLRNRTFIPKEGEDVEKWFIKCLSETVEIKMSAGKSKAHFYQSQCKRFILKSLKSAEGLDFIDPEFATNYFAYLNKCLDEGNPTTLCKIFGVYQVTVKNMFTNEQYKMFLIVMEDLFYNRDCSRNFDLKGVHKLLTASEPSYKTVVENKKMILDQHMTSVIQEDPIITRPHSKHVLMEAIERDGKFLSDNGRIDYSLLIGLDDSRSEMVVGIVDYLRKFGLDKKFEMVTKTVIIMFSNPVNRPADSREMMPTIVSPDLYYERFMIQMQQFILAVPDRWFGLETGVEKWSCGINSQGWSTALAGNRLEKVQCLDPYPTYLSYWEPNKVIDKQTAYPEEN